MINQVRKEIETLRLTVANTVVAGDVVVVGKICGVAETDYSAIDGKATVRVTGSYNLSVKGVNDTGNSAVEIGDRIYWTTGDTPKCSKKASGQLVGIALAVVESAATKTIEVALIGMLQSDDIGATTAHIADASTTSTAPVAVTGAALTGTVTGSANGVLEDIAAAAGACAGAGTPSATNVDSAIATAVAPIVTGLNLQVKEFMTIANALIVDIAAIRTRQGTIVTDVTTLTTKCNTLLGQLETAKILAAS
jgi:predicted RecA/RadA family phage recombinase